MDGIGEAGRIDDLQKRVDYLTLLNEAMWSFFEDQGHTEEQLVERIRAIDLMDGRLDDRHVERSTCPNCRASIVTDRCQFCGFETISPFAAI